MALKLLFSGYIRAFTDAFKHSGISI